MPVDKNIFKRAKQTINANDALHKFCLGAVPVKGHNNKIKLNPKNLHDIEWYNDDESEDLI